VWVETPTNPTLRLVDIQALAEIVHAHPGVILVVDNTFMSPYFQRPLTLGADIVLHSVTKYLNGHSDAVMGVVVTNSDELASRIRFLQNAIGAVPSAFDCYLANRGLKTLHLRMEQHQRNAFAVARFLEASPYVTEVIYPGTPPRGPRTALYRAARVRAKITVSGSAPAGGRAVQACRRTRSTRSRASRCRALAA